MSDMYIYYKHFYNAYIYFFKCLTGSTFLYLLNTMVKQAMYKKIFLQKTLIGERFCHYAN